MRTHFHSFAEMMMRGIIIITQAGGVRPERSG
jgi:hypothetical protein